MVASPAFNVPGSAGSSNNKVTNSTISGNFSALGGGLAFKYPGGSSKWTVSHSTVSHNEASEAGGGIDLGFVTGSFNLVDSTVSGNDAAFVGGGAYISNAAQKYEGALQFNNSTIASNIAGGDGGGLYLDYTEPGRGYVATPLFSTIVGDNAANGALNDLAEGTDTNPSAGAFDLSFSLVRAPGNATITQTPAGSNLIGVDPLLAGLGDNGGPTETQLPSINSPVVDKGSAPGNLTTDQRGLARTVDTSVPNAHDGTDIGAVELPPVRPRRLRRLREAEPEPRSGRSRRSTRREGGSSGPSTRRRRSVSPSTRAPRV